MDWKLGGAPPPDEEAIEKGEDMTLLAAAAWSSPETDMWKELLERRRGFSSSSTLVRVVTVRSRAGFALRFLFVRVDMRGFPDCVRLFGTSEIG